MVVVVKAVNFIGNEISFDVIYPNNVRWLSQANVLAGFVELRTEIEIFLTEKNDECS